MALNRHFKPIIKPLWQIINSLVDAIKKQSRDDDAASASKRERKEEEEEEEREKASETFERSPRKSDDRLHDYVQPIIISTPRKTIVPMIENWRTFSKRQTTR